MRLQAPQHLSLLKRKVKRRARIKLVLERTVIKGQAIRRMPRMLKLLPGRRKNPPLAKRRSPSLTKRRTLLVWRRNPPLAKRKRTSLARRKKGPPPRRRKTRKNRPQRIAVSHAKLPTVSQFEMRK